jgi:transcriptional regulator with XRE-family HTH domain
LNLVEENMTTLMEDIARRLRAARKAAGYKTAKDFAQTKNIPISTYSQHENGKRSISVELLFTYSSSFQVNPYWLLTGEGEPYLGRNNKEKKTILEKESFSITDKVQESSPNYAFIDVELLKKTLLAIEPLFNDESLNLSFAQLIDYCFNVYEKVSNIEADLSEKEKIIHLTISSLKLGVISEIKTK